MASKKKKRHQRKKPHQRNSSSSTSSSGSGLSVRRTKQIAVWVCSVFVLLNVIAYVIMVSKINALTARAVSAALSGYKLKEINVVNAHDHLYKKNHLSNYFKAAEKTGVARTLFVASSGYTLLGKTGKKDEMNDFNFREIVALAKEFPGKIIPFCTIYSGDPDKLDKIKQFVAEGAQELKLYTGHSNFYDQPLDADEMLPVYAYCEETKLPIVWHVNLQLYKNEFQNVMEQFPYLMVIVPHFGQAYWRPDIALPWIAKLIDTYPNIYTDTSLGSRQILVDGLQRVSMHRDLFREFCNKHSDRILFGTDMVVTGNKEKTPEWMESVIRACRDMLEKDLYYFFMSARGSKYANSNAHPYGALRGLALDDKVLRKIYETNIEKIVPQK